MYVFSPSPGFVYIPYQQIGGLFQNAFFRGKSCLLPSF